MIFWNKYLDWPPVWLLTFMALAWLQAQVWNPVSYQSGFSTMAGRAAIVLGIVLMGVSFMMFLRYKTSVVPKRTPKSIITIGTYKYSRNPIYLADTIILFGYILTLGSVIAFVLLPIFTWVIHTRFIKGEEASIRVEFGQKFEDYCKQTRRWI